jgi:hypothetical protein
MVVIDTSQGHVRSTDTRRGITPATKLRPPRVRHAEVTRSRLLEDPSVVEATIMGVHAPAGYGKTSFAVQWASRSPQPIVWITCDESDNDPLVLIASILAGIEQSGAGEASFQHPLTVAEPTYTRSILPAFAADVASLSPRRTAVAGCGHDADQVTADRCPDSTRRPFPAASTHRLVAGPGPTQGDHG